MSRRVRQVRHEQKSLPGALKLRVFPTGVGSGPPEFPKETGAVAVLAHERDLIEILPHATALWTRGRNSCIFNAAARALLGVREHEITPETSWVDHVHPQDRGRFCSALDRLQKGAGTVRIDYRFCPRPQGEPIFLTELTSLYSGNGAAGALETWSTFSEGAVNSTVSETWERNRLRELLVGLNHDVSNNLQAIKGEVALLKIAGRISDQTCSAVNHGIANIKKLLMEMGEYVSPSPLELKLENPAVVFAEVLRESEKTLAQHRIGVSFVVHDPLPPLPMGRQFRDALREVIQFSCALLPDGGEVKIAAGLMATEQGQEVEIRVENASASKLGMDEVDVFRPFLNINGRRIGLSMAVAREILRRHSGKIVFSREQRNRAVFSIRLKMPSTGE
jgi:signal transduction histidine kinase